MFETQDSTAEKRSVSSVATRAAQVFFMGIGIVVTGDWIFDNVFRYLF